MDYLKYWKLKQTPFASDSSLNGFFLGPSIQEAIARVSFLIESKRKLGVITGPESVGKTSVLRYLNRNLERDLPKNPLNSHFVSLQGVTDVEFTWWLSGILGAGQSRFALGSSGFRDAWRNLCDAAIGATASRTGHVLLLDDACRASEAVLGVIRRLLELNAPLTLLLCFNDEKLPVMSGFLRERSQLRIDLPSWDLGQTADYFDHRLEVAGGRVGTFEAAAITRIHEISDGLPRKINQLADLSLVAGASQRCARVSSELVEQIASEFTFSTTRFAGTYSVGEES